MEDTSRLVVQVSNQGINETTTMLQILANQGRNTEIAVKNLSDANKIHTDSSRGMALQNQASGESFGSLALKIAGYGTALNLGVSIARGAISEMANLGKEAVTLAGSFERSRVAWGVFMKDVSAGSQMFDELYGLAQRTPLTFQGVESAAQMLKGFGLAASDIIPTLERMGDVARGNDETMQRLALAYGQALAQGKVLTRDLYQFVNAGVPIFDALAQVMGKSVEQVQALVADGKVGFPEIEKALKALTEEGGQFNGMMEKAAETFEGRLSIATDTWKALLGTIGRDVLPTLKQGLDELNTGMDNIVSKSNALYYLKTGIGDPETVKKGLQAVMDRNTAMAEQNPMVKATGLNWNLGHTAPDNGGWQPLYNPLYENNYIKGLIAQIDATAKTNKNLGEAWHQTGSNLFTAPIVTPEETKWRNLLQTQGIQSWQKDWVKNENGTYTPAEKLTSGSELIQRQLNYNAIGFENVVGSKYEDDFRKEFTKKAEVLQEAMLSSGLWKIGEYSVSLIDAAIAKFGYKKPVKDTTLDDLAKEYARLNGPKGGQSGIAPPGDWSGAPSTAEQMVAFDYSPASMDARLSMFMEPEGTPMADFLSGYNNWLLGKLQKEFTTPQRRLAPEGFAPRNDFSEQLNPFDTESDLASRMATFSEPGQAMTEWQDKSNAWKLKQLQGEFTTPQYGQSGIAPEGMANGRNDFIEQIYSNLSREDISLAEATASSFGTPSEEAKAYVNARVKEHGDWLLKRLQDEFTTSIYGQSGVSPIGPNGKAFAPRNDFQEQIDELKTIIDETDSLSAMYSGFIGSQGQSGITPEKIGAGGASIYDQVYKEIIDGMQAEFTIPQYGQSGISPTGLRGQKFAPRSDFTEQVGGDIAGYSIPINGNFNTAVTDVEKYEQAVAKLNDEAGLSIDGYNQRLRELAEQYDPATKAAKMFGDAILTTTVNTLADEMYNLGNALVTGADGWTSFGDAMGDTLETIIKMLPKLAIQVGLSMLGNTNLADDVLGWGLIGGGLIGSVATGLLGNANGGVYSSPSLHQYANGVYDKPQTFAFARGGVFGEAGPEAIMPLSRDSAGRLGVKAQSSDSEIAVQIINQTSTQIAGKAKTVTDAAGNKKLIVTLNDMVDRKLAAAGVSTPGARKS